MLLHSTVSFRLWPNVFLGVCQNSTCLKKHRHSPVQQWAGHLLPAGQTKEALDPVLSQHDTTLTGAISL